MLQELVFAATHSPLLAQSHMSSLQSPYASGQKLQLSFAAAELSPKQWHPVEVSVAQAFEPHTWSSTLRVDVPRALPDSLKRLLPASAVLKLYDRRFATELRKQSKVAPWTVAIERSFEEFVASGGAAPFVASLNDTGDDDGDDDDDDDEDVMAWDAARCEAYLFDYCNSLYRTEVEAYERLQSLQGRNIPKLYGFVRFRLSSNSSAASSSRFPSPCLPASAAAETSSPELPIEQPAFFEVPGILVEFIDGFTLANLAEHTPPAVWQSVCDEAIRIVNLIGDHDILNDDVKTRNVLVRALRRLAAGTPSIDVSNVTNGAGTLQHANDWAIGGDCAHYDVVFIDFGHCRFREADETDAEWMHKKNVRDEEGAIGVVMESKLRAHGGGFEYHKTNHFSCRCGECVEVV